MFYLQRYEEAIEVYDKALAIEPASEMLLFYKAEALRALGRFDEAIASYGRLVELNGSCAEVAQRSIDEIRGEIRGYLRVSLNQLY